MGNENGTKMHLKSNKFLTYTQMYMQHSSRNVNRAVIGIQILLFEQGLPIKYANNSTKLLTALTIFIRNAH